MRFPGFQQRFRCIVHEANVASLSRNSEVTMCRLSGSVTSPWKPTSQPIRRNGRIPVIAIDRPSLLALMMATIALGACASERNANLDPAAPTPSAAQPIPSQAGEAGLNQSRSQNIMVVPASEDLMNRAAAGGSTIRKILSAAKPTIGTPYKWGGTDMAGGIDCSNYTWLLYRSIGVPYDRYIR